MCVCVCSLCMFHQCAVRRRRLAMIAMLGCARVVCVSMCVYSGRGPANTHILHRTTQHIVPTSTLLICSGTGEMVKPLNIAGNLLSYDVNDV